MAARALAAGFVVIAAILAGCKTSHRIHDPEYAYLTQAIHQARCANDPMSPALRPVCVASANPQSVDEYIQVALDQNPDIHAARKQLEAYAHQVPVAASLQDPVLGATVFPEPVQTAAGQQEFLLSASQKLPWFGKLSTKASVAESQTNVARARLAAVELAVIEKVKRAYYDLYFYRQAITITEKEQSLLADIRDVANTRYIGQQTSYQDVLRTDLEISNAENELIHLRQQQESSQARLARLLHIAPQTELRTLDQLPYEQVPRDLEWLQRQALATSPDLHAELAALERDRQGVDLARLAYFPDWTLGATWIDVSSAGISPVTNGRDSFLIGATVNLPIYRKRLVSSVRSAEAKAVATARQYDSLADGTQESVLDLLAQARSQEDLITLFREDILPKAQQTLEVSRGAYRVGQVDLLQLIDNWRQLLRYEIANQRLEVGLRQSLASLERVVGGVMAMDGEAIPVPDQQLQSLPQPEEEL